MNTTEIKFNNEITSFEQLYELAKDQFVNYEKLEGIDNWDEYDFSIDCSEDQMKFKDMIQIRFIEELTEASKSITEPDEHFWEEIGDSLNFFLSAYVMLGTDFSKLGSPKMFMSMANAISSKPSKEKFTDTASFAVHAYPVIEDVGYLCNLLKNRPWAQSNYLVSMYDFDERLSQLWCSFWMFLGDMGLTDQDVFEMFWKKYQVNRHRIETGY